MHEEFLFRELDFAFVFRNINVAVVAVCETVVEIKAAESGQTPFDTSLRADVGNELMSVLLLVFRRIEGIDEFDPEIGLDGFSGDERIYNLNASPKGCCSSYPVWQ